MRGHINQPASVLVRATRRCTTCRRVRRFVVRFYEWYPSYWTCGGCGHVFAGGEGRIHTTAKKRDHLRRWVRHEWPRLRSIRDMKQAIEDL